MKADVCKLTTANHAAFTECSAVQPVQKCFDCTMHNFITNATYIFKSVFCAN